ncbi:hypothetical protein SYPG_00052 [Synechococcus phage S-CBP3]|uniref:Uncharacterized protein n=2 Tax=Synechococcus phage S-CBP3 TaxID=756276 RepID=I3ULY7_9CAUD|nr:hypothetical protein S-CBP3_0011 [Synechococcus phage S-CBP3]YP_009822283.1 hypothetical protein HOV41_gp52 [Synechococcus phage S-CBP3]AFK66502.1 hypothetical protein SYPG_00052 [Synechococcus phage S-CBP3]AGK86568.1 hypothetical protein S-CBP3_0011 [Synechococcus phage S-CBP3]
MAYAKLVKALAGKASDVVGTTLTSINQFDDVVKAAAKNGEPKALRPDFVPIVKDKPQYDDAVLDSFKQKADLSTQVSELTQQSRPQILFDETSPYQGLNVSDDFSAFVNQKIRREARPQLPSDMAEQYRNYGKDLLAKQGSLKGHMKVNYEGQEFGLKSNTQQLASGEPSLKVRSKATRTAQDIKRQRMEIEQTIGTDEFKVGHHRAELDLIHRVMEGLGEGSRKNFINTVGKQFSSLVTGNKVANLIGPNGELPKPIHDAIHQKLREAGLDPRRMDFREATYRQRLQFMREVDFILKDIDKFVFESMSKR